ncbi:zinc ribbon domain-containing protein [Collinsella tanakaei]|uniref:zinc ribbon domain-containing protein n=1 Tax=Collinsella tanakaei TaxID=626935 RepID=UPI001956204C|nr:zinc ribbon domain-containing protein [Collinsella tanakaei]MBM6778918.1 zinc ribbon domain-containing protein [Collinsella tanakaei]
MASCPSCNEQISEGMVFCPKCGTKIDVNRTAESATVGTDWTAGDNGDLYSVAMDMVATISKLPVIRVDRREFLAKQFGTSPQLELIIAQGPQAVFSPDELRGIANRIINQSTTKTAALSFASGLPSNPVTMIAAGGADVVQYFCFAFNLAQQLAYLFGEDSLFADGTTTMSEESKIRAIAYLGAMLGVAGAAQLIARTSAKVGANLGKQVAAKALTKTVWYPVLKRVGALVGQNITKKTVEKTITKAVPVIGGAVSGALTLVTFRPMGLRLADVFADNLKNGLVPEEVPEIVIEDAVS